jgi:hypothetical protein
MRKGPGNVREIEGHYAGEMMMHSDLWSDQQNVRLIAIRSLFYTGPNPEIWV